MSISYVPAPATLENDATEAIPGNQEGSLTVAGGANSFSKSVSLYPLIYLWTAATTYQLNPNYFCHFAYLDAPTLPPTQRTLEITLPNLSGFPKSRCFFILYLRSLRSGDIFKMTPFETSCGINKLTAGASYEFITDNSDHLFFIYGSQEAVNVQGSTLNRYFIKTIQGRELDVVAGSGTTVNTSYIPSGGIQKTIVSWVGWQESCSYTTNASTDGEEYFGPMGKYSGTDAVTGKFFWLVGRPCAITQWRVMCSELTGNETLGVYIYHHDGGAESLGITLNAATPDSGWNDTARFALVPADEKIVVRIQKTNLTGLKSFQVFWTWQPLEATPGYTT